MHELTTLRNWVVTYLHDKIPLNPYTLRKADVSDKATWGDYGTALQCVLNNKHLWMGFVLTGSPFSCIDLDTYKTQDQAIRDYHRQIYETCQSYSELSPNGGVHIWCRGKLPNVDGRRLSRQYVEVYSNSRYMTVTGQTLNGFNNIEDRQQYLNQFVSYIDGQPAGKIAQPEYLPAKQTDAEVCAAAARAVNGQLFTDLYRGKWQGKYPSQSEADQAFVNIVAFYTDSMEQVAHILWASSLGKRKKAKRHDYLFNKGYGIIVRAFDQKLPNFYFKDIELAIQGKCEEEKQKVMKELSQPTPGWEPQPTPLGVIKMAQIPQFVKKELDQTFNEFPPGLTGEIAYFIYKNAVRPVKEIAIAGAVAFMAGIVGKLYNISEMGLNHYIAILAPTGTGKEGAAVGIEKLIKCMKERNPDGLFDLIMGPHEIASPQALMRHLSEVAQCCVSRHEEMGIWIQKICHRRANENNAGLRAMLLALYTSSGKGKVYRETIRADKKKDTPLVKAPAFSLYGDTTPDIFYSALDEEQLDQGLVSRFLVIECGPDKDYMFNDNHDRIVPDPEMLKRLDGLAMRCLRHMKVDDAELAVTMQKDVVKYLNEFRQECDEKRLNDPKGTESIVYSRAHERLLRLAGLVAVGVNPDCPVVTMDIAMWAKKLILRTMASVILRFEQGEVGEVNLFLLQLKHLKKVIKSYLDNGYRESMLTHDNINEEMFKWKLITHNYLSQRIRGYSAFRKSKNVALDLSNCVNELIRNGILVRIEMGKVRESFRSGTAYFINDVQALSEE